MTDFIIKTLGCKVNQCESSSLKNQLLACGYTVSEKTSADICVINTCTVTSTSDKKSLRMIRKLVRENSDAYVLVMGCTVDSDYDSIMAIDGVNSALGNKEKHKAIDIIKENVPVAYSSFAYNVDDDASSRTRKFIKIQDGCESFCSYCIIPYVRGSETSRSMDTILAEVKQAAEEGFREIVLTGIHLGRFNKGTSPSLPTLIEAIADITGIERIRLSSIEINEVTDELLLLIKDNPKVAPSLHIPLQHGSSRILELMERPYDAEQFLARIAQIKKILDNNVGFSTDIIVGFPGETDEDIEAMKEVVEEVGFHRVHIFPFSAREGTKAYSFANQIKPEIIKSRVISMKELTDKVQKAHYKNMQGAHKRILLEMKDEAGFYSGYSDFYEKVKIKDESNSLEKNTFVDVYIEKAYDDFCIGSLI